MSQVTRTNGRVTRCCFSDYLHKGWGHVKGSLGDGPVLWKGGRRTIREGRHSHRNGRAPR